MPRVTLRLVGFQGMNRRAGLVGNDAPPGGTGVVPMWDLINVDVSKLPDVLTPRPTFKPLDTPGSADTTTPIGET